MTNKLKIGLIGLGHLGKIHLKCLIQLHDCYQLVGIYDADKELCARLGQEFKVEAFDSISSLIDACQVIDIVTPTSTHFEIAKMAIEKGKHIFVEKPLTSTLEEAKAIYDLATKHKIFGQVGFVERFNPALLAIHGQTMQPMFIEAHRLALFNPRGTDVSVVLDLMIHDLDILLKLVNSEVRSVQASGVSIVSKSSDIANARIEFINNAVANITASRISLKNMRKFRLFQSDAYISLDFLDKKAEIVRMYSEETADKDNMMELETADGKRYLALDMPESKPINAIQTELELFAKSIEKGEEPTVSLLDGVKALELAYKIMDAIELHQEQIGLTTSTNSIFNSNPL